MHARASRASRKIFLLSLLLTLAASGRAGAQDGAVSTWQCLPEETAFAFRIPNGKAFADACVQNTKLGAVLFSEKRRAILLDALNKSQDEDWVEFQKKLTEYGLTKDEVLKFFAGESGYAVVVSKDAEGKPLPLGLAWLEPGEELAGRAYDILARAIEEGEDAERAIVREDLQLAERPVMKLMMPHVTTERQGEPEPPEGYEEMTEEEQEAAWDEAYRAWEASAVEKTNYSVVLVSTLGSRVLLAHGYRENESQDNHPDAEALTEIFTRLLAEHASGAGGFANKYADNAVVSRIMAVEGVPGFEFLGDVAALLPLARAAAGENEGAEKVLRILGADGLGAFAMRSTLENTEWRSEFGLSVAQPRQGLLKWLDQPALDSEPPAWVPANAISMGQFSFDFGKAYAILKEEIMREFPEQAGQYFGMAEMQVMGFAQSSLEEVLSSLGTRHVAVNFEAPRDAAVSIEAHQPESTAVVWQVTDEQLWTRLLTALAPMITTVPGGEVADEQGYNGVRFKNEAVEGGLLLGNGNLVLAYGPQVLETTLSSLNNPPEGAGSFRGGELYQQATALLEPGSARGYRVVDGSRYAAILRNWINEFLAQQGELEDDEQEAESEDVRWAKVARELMPTDEELKDMFGAIVSRWEVTDDGVFGASVQHTPPPDGR